MKKLFFVLLSCLSLSIATAQEAIHFTSGKDKHDSKPQLFANLSPKFSVKPGFFNNMLGFKNNDLVTITVTDGFVFEGKVITKTVDNNGLEIILPLKAARKRDWYYLFQNLQKAMGLLNTWV
jgi:hypothetical protein